MALVNVENSPTPMLVVAAAIFGPDGRLLLQQALPHKRHAGCWEFPGGKLEALESPRFGLRREVREELAISLDETALEPVGFAEEAPDEGRVGIVLLLYKSLRWSGVPQALEGQRWDWFTPEEACLLPMAGMDAALLETLRRNACC